MPGAFEGHVNTPAIVNLAHDIRDTALGGVDRSACSEPQRGLQTFIVS